MRNVLFSQLLDCQLNCKFCFKHYKKYQNDYMNFKQFEKILLYSLDKNIQKFDLTPLLGDPLLDKELLPKLQKLADVNTCFEINTNALNLDMLIKSLDINTNQFTILISLYNMKQIPNILSFLEAYYTKKSKINIVLIERIQNNIFKILKNKYPDIAYKVEAENGSWGGINMNKFTETNIKFNTICDSTAIGIWANGDVSTCGCCDINKNTILGNIFEEEIQLSTIDIDSNILCNNCILVN